MVAVNEWGLKKRELGSFARFPPSLVSADPVDEIPAVSASPLTAI